MNLTDEDIIKILKLVEQSKFDSLHLEYGDLKLTVGKGGKSLAHIEAGKASVVPAAPDSAPAGAFGPGKEKAAARVREQESAPNPKAAAAVDAEAEGLIPVTAPMVGIFYCSPEPGADPFVGAGSRIEEDTVVGLIEVMKVFTSVRSGVKGKIERCLVEDAQFVEYGQPLFLVRPDEEKDG